MESIKEDKAKELQEIEKPIVGLQKAIQIIENLS
jgi:hypothetical protein